MIASMNPLTGERVREYTPDDAKAVDSKLARAASAFVSWRARPLEERVRVVQRAGEILVAEKEQLGALMTMEMGKLLSAAVEEAAKCATACSYYAENAHYILAPETLVDDEQATGTVIFQPLGPVLAIMPWNFPFWQVFRFAAPALAAGNVGLLKHASNVPGCALAIEDIFKRAGAPPGVFQTLLVRGSDVEPIIADPRVAAATLTGSEAAGRSVGAAAGKNIKKTVLELGGSDPFIVMPSADVAATAKTAVTARTINNGQSCIAAKRFIVHEAIYDEFERLFVDGMRALKIGDPMAKDTQVGPLATPQIRDQLAKQVQESIERGAKPLCGGHVVQRPGNFYEPTVLAEVPPDSPAYREELFGPVASLFRARDLSDAIRIANDTTFGLGASAWTNDADEQKRFALEIESGQVFINSMVVSDARLPFGGIKHSGYGRELSPYGMREFVNIKTVRVAKAGDASASIDLAIE
jgi:succinate-semialdehyde dehydrogenase/glutarate-semialdehyde dehydrogenase